MKIAFYFSSNRFSRFSKTFPSVTKTFTPPSPERAINQAEEMRQQRNEEAKQLIGNRVGTAKAMFTQNTASGQMTTAKAAPAKPIRNSIAQRINSLSKQANEPPIKQEIVVVEVPPPIVEEPVEIVEEPEPPKLIQDEERDDQYSTIKRSPYTKTNSNNSQVTSPEIEIVAPVVVSNEGIQHVTVKNGNGHAIDVPLANG